jgi:tight adherence protein B
MRRSVRLRQSIERRLDDAALPWPSGIIVRAMAGAFALAELLALAVGGWPMAAVAAIAFVIGGWVASGALRGRAALVIDLALPGVLEATARSLRSGTSLRIALSESTSHAPPRLRDSLAAVVVAAERGVPLVGAIDVWAKTTAGDGVRLAGAALAMSAELGGASARALDAVAATLRDRNGVRREVKALSSQARASAVVMGIAPLGFAVLAATIDPQTIHFLLRTPVGVTCLLVGVVLDGLGAAWMHRLASIP